MQVRNTDPEYTGTQIRNTDPEYTGTQVRNTDPEYTGTQVRTWYTGNSYLDAIKGSRRLYSQANGLDGGEKGRRERTGK